MKNGDQTFAAHVDIRIVGRVTADIRSVIEAVVAPAPTTNLLLD